MTYQKGSDAKIKNIEELDSVDNRGIEIIHKTDIPETIEVEDGLLSHTPKCKKPKGFEGW